MRFSLGPCYCNISPNGKEELIQVCADSGSGEMLEREMRAMKDAAADFPRAKQRFLVLTFDQLSAMTVKCRGYSRRFTASG